METVRERAERAFADAASWIVQEQKAMHTQHAAKHQLQSGATIRAAARIYEAATAEAIDLATDAITRRLESRGRAWNNAMQDVREALAAHADKADELVSLSTTVAARGDGGRLVTPILAEANNRLRQRVEDFAQGWTSPKGKKWNERHPVLYAIAMMVAGGLVTAAIAAAVAALGSPKAKLQIQAHRRPTAATAAHP